jgi:hypothetical protein
LWRVSRPTASSTVAARWYSKLAGYMASSALVG